MSPLERRIRARARRFDDQLQYESGDFYGAKDPKNALARATEDVKRLDKKIPVY